MGLLEPHVAAGTDCCPSRLGDSLGIIPVSFHIALLPFQHLELGQGLLPCLGYLGSLSLQQHRTWTHKTMSSKPSGRFQGRLAPRDASPDHCRGTKHKYESQSFLLVPRAATLLQLSRPCLKQLLLLVFSACSVCVHAASSTLTAAQHRPINS